LQVFLGEPPAACDAVAVQSEASRPPTPPSVDDIRRIAAIANPVIRNLEITNCYSRLSAAFATGSGAGANWCTYATWASRQAGRTIRGEDLLAQLGRRLGKGRWLLHPLATLWHRLLRHGLFQPGTRLARLTAELHTPFDAFELASDAVARGNLKVFQEIGLEFARYLHDCPADGPADPEAFLRFRNRLLPGDPPDGQRYLGEAFAVYERRRLERDPKVRVELAVLANLEIGFHEQMRLEPEIREALDAAYATQEDLGRRCLEALFPTATGWRPVVRRPAAALVGLFARGAQRATSRLARELITDAFMTLSLPGRVLALGTHLADPYPDALREPSDAALLEFLHRFEPAPRAPDDCGARDWSDFRQRMHYIVHLCCACHMREDLLRPPFTPEQVASFGTGVVPDGEL
jgi:hypothetical protein